MNNHRITNRVMIAEHTLAIMESGYYEHPQSGTVSIQADLAHCVEHTHLFTPEELTNLEPKLGQYAQTTLEVVNETTLEGALRLSQTSQFSRIGVLNFASAKNPGGGFLRGSQAQEESLARSSGLYASLQACPAYYDYHRHKNKSLLYSDHMIYSPACPVFKQDNGSLLAEPYLVDFITSPAPNHGALIRNEPEALSQLESVFARRTNLMLKLAAWQGCDALVLGAWGCGVFANDPELVARLLATELLDEGAFAHAFKHISFSIPDNARDPANNHAFQQQFANRIKT
ncbi:TIGR02452 family protein [Thiofilum flexile]|uniref:TIGR02452 family protein n=1 Tax=Thiofilum flexile TaxID=125627 RepID=UPI0003605A19|nr:TIGR02452 family protein [Thiofilum flexile]